MSYKLLKFNNGTEKFYDLQTDQFEMNDLLEGTLTLDELYNYNYLCTEMTNLVNAGNFCNSNASQKEINNYQTVVYPNPFSNRIVLSEQTKNESVTLFNHQGELIYRGCNIEKQDLTSLPIGLYFLKIDQQVTVIKLIKI